MAERVRIGGSRVVWEALLEVLEAGRPVGAPDERAERAKTSYGVVDVGGGTGGFAVPLAELGHRITVVDPNPDALATLERRAAEAGVSVSAVQGDAAGLLDVVPPASADLVLCHGVLEQVDNVASAVAALAQVLRPAGSLSVVAANRDAVVVSRAMTGRFSEARHALDDPDGRWGARDPLPRRFSERDLLGLLTDAGLEIIALHGVRTLSDLVPGAMTDADPGAHQSLLELEAATAERPAFRAIATHLHVLARKP